MERFQQPHKEEMPPLLASQEAHNKLELQIMRHMLGTHPTGEEIKAWVARYAMHVDAAIAKHAHNIEASVSDIPSDSEGDIEAIVVLLNEQARKAAS